MELPKEFTARMEKMLGGEYADFLECMDRPHFRGIRRNSLKCGEDTLCRGLGVVWDPVPFSGLSSYLPAEYEHIGNHPLHHAGAFYVQEPSASSAVTALDPHPGDRVLDLCAAPGGKSTQIAALLDGKGLLWSNEIVKNRASILLSNIERMGIRNAVVSSCHPEVLCERFAGCFDKVLVDAPCSGEGMFRRDPQAVSEWSPEHVQACAARQLAILESASQAVREGGILVYSTCTFSMEENEGVIAAFLRDHDFVLEEIPQKFGRPGFGDFPQTRRIFPMDGGEGHFVARMRRLSGGSGEFPSYGGTKPDALHAAEELYCSIFGKKPQQEIAQAGDRLLLLPEETPALSGLGVLRAGVLLGLVKKGRIEPEHALFAAAQKEDLVQCLDYAHDSPEIAAFLHGEELEADGKGYLGVCVDGITVGFGKASGGRLKNRYPKGLRACGGQNAPAPSGRPAG